MECNYYEQTGHLFLLEPLPLDRSGIKLQLSFQLPWLHSSQILRPLKHDLCSHVGICDLQIYHYIVHNCFSWHSQRRKCLRAVPRGMPVLPLSHHWNHRLCYSLPQTAGKQRKKYHSTLLVMLQGQENLWLCKTLPSLSKSSRIGP